MQSTQLIVEERILRLIVVDGARLFDTRLSLVQFSLAQFDDGTQAETVTRLRQIKSLVGLV